MNIELLKTKNIQKDSSEILKEVFNDVDSLKNY